MKPNTQTKPSPPRNYAVGYARFSHLRTQAASRSNMVPMYAPRQRRLERGEIHDERQHATVLSKNNLHAWAQRSQCGQGWTVYFPATPNNFVGKFVKTLREALVVMAGWLNFTETEALQVIK